MMKRTLVASAASQPTMTCRTIQSGARQRSMSERLGVRCPSAGLGSDTCSSRRAENDERASHRMHQAECSYQSHPYEQDRKHPDELGCGLPRESRQHRNHQKWQACQHTTKGEKYS